MPDKITFECPRCKTRWERPTSELNAPDIVIHKDGGAARYYTYRDKCRCGTFVVTEITVQGGSDA
jgi:hypothetical protein